VSSYVARRLLLFIPTLLLVSLGVFSLLRLIPGDAVMAQIATTGMVPKANLDAARRQLGLDAPFFVQYLRWLAGILHGNLGTSLVARQTVLGRLEQALPITAELAILALVTSTIVAIPLGVISALKYNSALDHVARVLAVTGIATPDFFIGTIVILFLSLWLRYLPPSGFEPLLKDPLTNISQMWIPGLILGVRLAAITTRLTRATMLDVLHEDYVRTAIAKGLRPRHVLVRHALKNALIPIITVMGGQFTALMAGAVVIETLFSLPGIGQLTLASIQARDYTQIQGNVLVFAMLVLTVNLGVDILYAQLDPRIQYR
jgi:peptide/nickel transport system permease protein